MAYAQLKVIALIVVFWLPIVVPTVAKAEALNIVRDAEIEESLRTLAAPIFEQARIAPNSVHFVLVNSREVNAFVAGGMNMFFTTGLLRLAKSPEELIGVIAHETGHIAGGHLVRGQEAMQNASAEAIIATIAGLAAAVAAGNGGAGAATMALGQQVAQRSFLSYSRTQESSADQAAMTYLSEAGVTLSGLQGFLNRLADQELLPEDQQIEFARTHPMTRDRIDSLQSRMKALPSGKSLANIYSVAFKRMQAKLESFIDPRIALRNYPPTNTSFDSRYARTIALHQTGDSQGALILLATLIKDEPSNPYLYELRGQILFESGKSNDAVPDYRKAVALSQGTGLLRLGLAQALLDAPQTSTSLQEARDQLEAASSNNSISSERGSPLLWRLLATVYGRQNDLGMAAYALSEEAMARGDKSGAKNHAKRAISLLPEGSSGWLKASDVLANADSKGENKP